MRTIRTQKGMHTVPCEKFQNSWVHLQPSRQIAGNSQESLEERMKKANQAWRRDARIFPQQRRGRGGCHVKEWWNKSTAFSALAVNIDFWSRAILDSVNGGETNTTRRLQSGREALIFWPSKTRKCPLASWKSPKSRMDPPTWVTFLMVFAFLSGVDIAWDLENTKIN